MARLDPGTVLLTFDPTCEDDLETLLWVIKAYVARGETGNLKLVAA